MGMRHRAYRDLEACPGCYRVEDSVIHLVLVSEELLEMWVIHQGASHCQLYMWLVDLHIQCALWRDNPAVLSREEHRTDNTYQHGYTLQTCMALLTRLIRDSVKLVTRSCWQRMICMSAAAMCSLASAALDASLSVWSSSEMLSPALWEAEVLHGVLRSLHDF